MQADKKRRMEEDFPLDGYVERKIKNGYKRKCAYPDNGIPKLPKGDNKGVRSPSIAAFGLDKNGE